MTRARSSIPPDARRSWRPLPLLGCRPDAGGHDGWWRHRDGGYGWVGPVFWPFAYYDFYDYAFWGMATMTRSGVTATAISTPASSPPMATTTSRATVPQAQRRSGQRRAAGEARRARDAGTSSRRSAARTATTSQGCRLISSSRRSIRRRPAAALDDLAKASAKASSDIKAACPEQAALTAPLVLPRCRSASRR